MTQRGDTSARAALAAAFASGLALAALLWAPPAGAGTGGAAPPPPDTGSTSEDGSLRLMARPYVLLGRRVAVSGTASGAHGKVVALHYRVAGGRWMRIGRATTSSDGSFRTKWKPPRAGALEVRARVLSGSGTHGAASGTAVRQVAVHRPAIATWYGPGFYGRQTACGIELQPDTYGVAHRTLACGTQVSIVFGSRRIVVPVIDRGPYGNDADWDLTQAAAEQVGMTTTSRIGAMPLAR